MPEFADLREELKHYLNTEQIIEIEKAYLLAKDAHSEQTRSSGEPYITHPIAVAKILAQIRMDKQTIIAAILHDVIEDTHIEKKTLANLFGQEVADLVDGVSKLTQIKFETKAEAQAANFRKMMMAMAKDIRVIVIKLADRLHNMRTLEHVAPEKRYRIARETLEIYAPISNRLGMRAFRDEFYDIGFFCLYPLRYKVLKESVRNARGNRKEIINKIENVLHQGLVNANIDEFILWGREKNLFSIYKKMRSKHIRLSEVLDVYGFRILVKSVDMCYRALGAVHGLYKPVPERFKDYIAIPKANGYQSLHTTLFGPYGLPIEIQIRTYEMDKMAENGIAAHWLYKSDEENVVNQAQLRAREWIKGVLEIQQSAGNSLEFIENVKIDLFPDEVYIFTPQGDILELPHGATAVDFAYAVHSDVGSSCIAAKVDRRLVPLSTVLRSGQTVEIITAPGARPNPAWLNFVATGKARGEIRHFLKKQQRNESINLGRRLLEQALKNTGYDLTEITETALEIPLKDTGYKTLDDLLEAIGLGNQMAPIVAQRLLGQESTAELGEMANEDKEELVIKGSEGMAVSFAKCCYPIPGDTIVGVLTAGRGIVVHTEHCGNLIEARRRHPEKCLPIRWEEGIQGEFQVNIMVEMENQRGSLARLALAVANAESSIDDVSVELQDARYAKISMLITVSSRIHLARVMRRIRQIGQVHRIYRARNVNTGKKKKASP